MINGDNYVISEAERARLDGAKQSGAKGRDGVSELLEMLVDPSWVVRRTVVETLAAMGDEAIAPMCQLLRTKRDNEARIAALVDALSFSRGHDEQPLYELAQDKDNAVITDALQIFGRRQSVASVPLLIELTKHVDDIVAVGSIEALGRIGGRSAIQALIETIQTGNFFRTFPAIDILGRSGDRRVIEPVAQLLGNPTYLPEAARALGRSGEVAAISPLIALLKSPIDSVVRIAITSLWDLRERFEEKSGGESDKIDDMLKNQVTSEIVRRISRVMSGLDNAETVAACHFLGAIRNAESATLLTSKLDGPEPVAHAAANALKRIGKESDLHLLQAIREGDSARRKVLLPIVTRTATALDVAQCLEDPDPEVRAIACDTVARLGNVAVVSQVFRLLEDPNLRVVHAATAALQALGSRETRELAVQAAKSVNPGVRRAALRILAYFGDSIALEPILNGLNDEDPRIREAAIQGLPYMEDPLAYMALCNATKHTEAKTRALAVRALSQVAKVDELTYSLLLKALKDTDAWVRYYACQSLGRLAYSPASEEIADLLKDEAGQVRVSAVEALSHLQSRQAHKALQYAAISEESDVKRAALVGLGIMHWPDDLPIVLNALNSEEVATRLIALSSIVSFQSPLVLGALSAAASDTSDQVSSAAIDLIAARSEVEATEILVELLNSKKLQDRAKTALLIPQLSRSSGILTALETASDDLAPTLISILLRSGRADSRRALFSAMKSTNVAARKAAAMGMASNRDFEKIEALKEAKENDPDQSVRDICSLLLSE